MAGSEPVDELTLMQQLLGALNDAPMTAEERVEFDRMRRDVDGAVLRRDAEAVQARLDNVEPGDTEAIRSIGYETMWLLQRKSQLGQS